MRLMYMEEEAITNMLRNKIFRKVFYETCNNTNYSLEYYCNETFWENLPLDYHDADAIDHVVKLLVAVFFILVISVGLFGNSLVVFVVIANTCMRNPTNLLILNLAIADLLFIVFCVPFTAVDYLFESWPFGTIWCSIVHYLIWVNAYASVYTLVLMSLDRFLAVVFPVTSIGIRTERNTTIAIVIMWSIILLACIPVLLAHSQVPHVHKYIVQQVCRFIMESWSWPVFQIVFFLTSYIIPLSLICILYLFVLYRLWFRVGPRGHSSAEGLQTKRRVIKMVVGVVVAFSVCWGPLQILLLLKSLGVYETSSSTIYAQIGMQVLAYINSCLNPILYAFLSENFRKAFRNVIYCWRNRQRNVETIERDNNAGQVRCTNTAETAL